MRLNPLADIAPPTQTQTATAVLEAPPRAVTPAPAPQPQPAPAPAAPEFNPLAGFTFGGPLATPARKKGKTEYPVVPDSSGELAKTAARYKREVSEKEALEGSIALLRADILKASHPFWFAHHLGLGQCVSSVSIPSEEGDLLVTFPEKFKLAPSPAHVVQAIGAEAAQQLFRPAFELKVKSDALPEGPQTQALLSEVYAVFAKYGATGAVEFTQSLKPRKGFNQVRHARLTPQQNLAIEAVCPMIPMLKTKGRDED